MIEKICRLCLQTITKNDQTIEESSLKTLKLNLNITAESVMCVECASYLQVFSNFKPACAYMGDDGTSPLPDLKNEANLDLVRFETKSNPKSLTVTGIQCSFCAKTNGTGGLVSLNGSKENEFLVNMLKQHIPLMNLKNTKDLLTCGTCLDALQGLLSFILKCLEVEEKIYKYAKMEGTDHKGQIELKDVQQFTFAPTVKLEIEAFGVNELGQKCQQIRKNYTTTTAAPIKDEEKMDTPELINKTELVDIKSEHPSIKMEHAVINSQDLVIKTDHVDIKLENSDSDSFQVPFIEHNGGDPLEISAFMSETRPKYIKTASEATTFKCEMCPYQTDQENCMKRHILTHNNIPSDINMFSCELCSFSTKNKYYLKTHLLTHKSSSEITMFKCEMCSYEAKRKHHLKQHLLIHKSPSEGNIFKCELCAFDTKSIVYLKRHLMIHKSSSEVTMFKCEMCSYEAKRKHHLKQHMLTHKTLSEINSFQCELCSYSTKRKDCLKSHLLTHKSPFEANIFKCEFCSFNTKRKAYLDNHLLTHKSPSEISMFKCEMCSYETKRKYHLKRHFLIHKSPSQINMFKCETCSYETKCKEYLKQHYLIHKSPSEIKMFTCELCSFETKRISDLKRHVLTHRNGPDK